MERYIDNVSPDWHDHYTHIFAFVALYMYSLKFAYKTSTIFDIVNKIDTGSCNDESNVHVKLNRIDIA